MTGPSLLELQGWNIGRSSGMVASMVVLEDGGRG